MLLGIILYRGHSLKNVLLQWNAVSIINYEVEMTGYSAATPFNPRIRTLARVRTGPGKPGKSWKFKISKSRPGKPEIMC